MFYTTIKVHDDMSHSSLKIISNMSLSIQNYFCSLVNVYQNVFVITDSDVFIGVTDRHLVVAKVGGFLLNVKAC